MKKISVLVILFLSFMIMPNVFAKDTVSIKSVTVDSKSGTTEVINDATYNGLSINFDVKFFGVNDYIKYKVVVDNPTNKDYEITSNNDLNLGEYISYDYNYGDTGSIIKKNSQMTMYINIKYDKEIPSDLFRNGVYTERNNLTIDLGNDDKSNNIVNPKTGNYILIFVILLMIIGISIVVFNPLNNKKYYSLIIIGLLLLPISIYALEKLQINIDSNVVVSSNPKFCCTLAGKNYYLEYENGMTWNEFLISDYNKADFTILENSSILVYKLIGNPSSRCPIIDVMDTSNNIDNTSCYPIQYTVCK